MCLRFVNNETEAIFYANRTAHTDTGGRTNCTGYSWVSRPCTSCPQRVPRHSWPANGKNL